MKLILSNGDKIEFTKSTIAQCYWDNFTSTLSFNYNIPLEDIPKRYDGLIAIGNVHHKEYMYLIDISHVIGIDKSV